MGNREGAVYYPVVVLGGELSGEWGQSFHFQALICSTVGAF